MVIIFSQPLFLVQPMTACLFRSRLSGGYVSSWLSGRIFRHFFFFMSQPVGKELQHTVKA